MLSVDIETGNRQIKCIGFATSRSHAIVIPFVDLAHASGSYWPTPEAECQAWGIVRAALESPIPKLFQNGVYDLQYIVRMGIRPKGEIHDTMLLHHSLFSELRKGLGFLGSIYTDEASWKLMNRPKADTEKREE
jgi:DNA polymerase I-like protein with 3'-5' exonuclease and polymerase domains